METWTEYELPVLQALVAHFTESNAYLRTPEYAGLVPNLSPVDIYGAIRRLSRAVPPYMDHGGDASAEDESGVPWAIVGVTERAMREVGQWPTPEQLTRRIAEALLAAADAEPDDEQANMARKTASWVAGLASGTGSGVAAMAIARAFGVG